MTGRKRISFQNVRKEFETPTGPLLAIDDVSLDIHHGEFVSVIGPSGCGKTTMLNMIAGFQQPTSGTLTLDDKPIRQPGADRGVIFQDYGVFPWLTVRENIGFGLTLKANRVSAAERKETVDRYLQLMGLSRFGDAFPRALSGGMRQRVALARAYAVKSEFLLMDEPFGALDAQTRTAMQNLLLEALRAEGKTVFLITHSVEEALYLSSRVVVVSARPSRIRKIIDVPFSFPRHEQLHRSPEFAELQYEIREMVMREYAAQENMQATRAA